MGIDLSSLFVAVPFSLRHVHNMGMYWADMCTYTGFPLRCWFANFEEDGSFEPGIWERLGIDGPSLMFSRR